MKKSIDRCYEQALEKYHLMCGTPLEQALNAAEAEKFAELVRLGIVVVDEVTSQNDVQRCDVDMRFFEEFDQRWW